MVYMDNCQRMNVFKTETLAFIKEFANFISTAAYSLLEEMQLQNLVANIGKTAEAIQSAMSIAGNRAGLNINFVNVGVAGEHITSIRHRNYVTISSKDKEITKDDLDRLEADVRTIRIPSDRQILHIIPEEFSVDHQPGIEKPIGMSPFAMIGYKP